VDTATRVVTGTAGVRGEPVTINVEIQAQEHGLHRVQDHIIVPAPTLRPRVATAFVTTAEQ